MQLSKIVSNIRSVVMPIALLAVFICLMKPAWAAIKPHPQLEGAPAKIVACIPPDFKPTYFKDDKGQAVGFIVDLLNEMAVQHNVEVEWVFGANWAELIKMVQDGTADVLPSLTMSPAREKILDFTAPVEFVDIGLIVRSDSSITGFTPGLRVGTPKGSKPVKIMQEKYPDVIIVEMRSMEQMLVALLGGEIDATFVMMPNFMLVAQKTGVRGFLKELQPPLYIANRGMAVKKGNTELLKFLNHSISSYHGTPEYEAIHEKWYGKPEPFWTTKRITFGSGFLLLFTICFMAYWRYRSIVSINKGLHESEARFREIVDGTDNLITQVDKNGSFVFVNHVGAKIFGIDVKQLIGMKAFQFVHPDDQMRTRDWFDGCCKSRISRASFENRQVSMDGSQVYHLLWTCNFYYNEQGECLGVNGIAHNITDLRQAEEEKSKMEAKLRQAQKMESIGTLAGGIAHDFNNILTAVLGYTELVLSEADIANSVRENLDEVYKGAIRAKELVQQILTFSRECGQQLNPMSIQLVSKEVLKLLRSSIPTTIEIRQNIDSDCGMVLADPTQIHQLIMNLCTNAYQAMRETGGVLGVSLHSIILEKNDVGRQIHLQPGKYVKLEISDTGAGMSKDVLDKVFEPYFTTKDKGEGTGLGLAVVHGIVTKLNGDITVYSEPGKGTTFNTYLPIVEPTQIQEQIVHDDLPEQLVTGSERILLVDDYEEIVNFHKTMLEQLGYRVTVQTSSVETIHRFRENPDDFDLVITDMTMPKMTGAELARQILTIRPNLPIILCTGYSELIDEKKAKAIGIRGYVMKPVIRKDFLMTIRNVLDAS